MRLCHVQHGAENIMRNVAKRLLHGEAAQSVIAWRMKVVEYRNNERGQCILRRVGGRWRNDEVSMAFCMWHAKQVEDRNRERGEAIMKRVGGRWRHRELAARWDAWHQNYKEDTLAMVTAPCMWAPMAKSARHVEIVTKLPHTHIDTQRWSPCI